MTIYLEEKDIGQQRFMAIQNFLNTVNQLKQVRRDKEIVIGFNKIDRDAQIQIDEIAETVEPEQQEFYIQRIKSNARNKKLDLLNQAGEFTPQQYAPGLGGFMNRIMGAISPLDTRGVTTTPLTQMIYKRMIESQFPTAEDELSQSYLRERIKSTKALTKQRQAKAADMPEQKNFYKASNLMRAGEGYMTAAWQAGEDEEGKPTKEAVELRKKGLEMLNQAYDLMKGVKHPELNKQLNQQKKNIEAKEKERKTSKKTEAKDNSQKIAKAIQEAVNAGTQTAMKIGIEGYKGQFNSMKEPKDLTEFEETMKRIPDREGRKKYYNRWYKKVFDKTQNK